MRYFRVMEERSKIDLQSNRLSRFNRWYLLKTLFYVLLILGLIGYLIYAMQQKQENTEIQEKRIEKLKIVIASLPPKCKRIFELNKMEGLRYQDISDLLGISIKTIEAQMGIAFKKIRKAFKEDVI